MCIIMSCVWGHLSNLERSGNCVGSRPLISALVYEQSLGFAISIKAKCIDYYTIIIDTFIGRNNSAESNFAEDSLV